MKHPISGKALILYILTWLLIIVLQAVIIRQVSNFSLEVCLADAAVYNLLLAGFGMSYYFAVSYLSKSGKITVQEVITHLAGVTFIVLLISVAHGIIMRSWVKDENYLDYLQFSLSWRIASGVLLILILVLIYYLYNHNQYIRSQEKRAADMRNMLKESEMEMLKFQINPHFIFNSLNSISALTMSSPEKAQEMVIKLSHFFRNALGKERRDVHDLREEMEQMKLYLEMEQVRFGDRLDVHMDIPEECLDKTIPALILQPLYENAIKHGVYEKLDNVTIKTTVMCSEGMMNITISNSYDSSHHGSTRGTGIGLKNVRSRLELMYGIPDLVTIERTRELYRVIILIPQTNDQGINH